MAPPPVAHAASRLQLPHRKEDVGAGPAIVAGQIEIAPTSVEGLGYRDGAVVEPDDSVRVEVGGAVGSPGLEGQRDGLIQQLHRDTEPATVGVGPHRDLQGVGHAHRVADAFVVRVGVLSFRDPSHR